MVDSGEYCTSMDSARYERLKRRQDAAGYLTESLHGFNKVLHGHQPAQQAASRLELLP